MATTLSPRSAPAARIIPLGDAADRRETGGKASRLAQLMVAGEHVPDGFCVIGSGDPAVALAAEAYRRLGPDVPVAVRSSASTEDGAESSFAGQFETVLNVVGEQQLATALASCWESLSDERVQAYLERRNLAAEADSMTMSVLVQRMVDARVAGVAFSADPLLGTRDVVVIHAASGLGADLVSGEITPDRYRVELDGRVTADAGVGDGRVVDDDEARAIAVMVRRIAASADTPQDVEWAIDGDGLWLLQARPMTALPPEVSWESPVPGAKWVKDLQAAEWATEPLSPLGATTTFEAMARARERYRGWPPIPKAYSPGHTIINGWLYMRVGGPVWSLFANIAGSTLQLLTIGIDGHRRARRRWRPRLAELDMLASFTPRRMDDIELRNYTQQLLDALGWWWIEVSFFASLVRVGQMLVSQSATGLDDAGVLFRGNDSLLLESERALRRASEDPGELPAYVGRFGHLVDSADPIHPTLGESPETVRWQLEAARANPHGPDERLAKTRAERAKAEATISRLRGVRGFFARRAQAAGQSHAAHTDDAVYHLQRLLALIRAALLEQGRRLADTGRIARPEDVFYLTTDEVWTRDADLRGGVATRRALREGQSRLAPPPMIPAATDASWTSDPVLKRMPAEMRAQLMSRGLQVRDGRRLVVGTPASGGIAKGIARVIAGPSDFARFSRGDVLVAHATSPMWTPLLAIASAAVTEVGGPFAHAAIVAREFGIPLVDGALDATRSIPDGAPVVVDGSSGVVEIAGQALESPPRMSPS